MKINMKTLAACLFVGCFSSSLFAEVVVITNPSSGIASLSKNEIKRIFLGKDKNFPNGSVVTPVDQSKGSGEREKFYTQVAEKNEQQLKSYWATMVFSGKSRPPAEVGSSADVVTWISKTPGAIGYVDKSFITPEVVVVLTVD